MLLVGTYLTKNLVTIFICNSSFIPRFVTDRITHGLRNIRAEYYKSTRQGKIGQVKSSRDRTRQVKSNEVKSSHVKSSEAKSRQDKSSQMKSTKIKLSQVKSSEVKSCEFKSSQSKSSQDKIHFQALINSM